MAFPLAQPARPRPAMVGIASTLLIVLGLLQLVRIGFTIYEWQITKGVLPDLISNPSKLNQYQTGLTAGSMISIALNLIIGVGMIMVGVYVGRGKQAARILAWIIGGILLLCTGLGLATGLLGSKPTPAATQDPDVPTTEQLTKAIQAKLAGWYGPTATLVSLAVLVGMIVVVVMLALPASHEYFRKPVAAFVPPTEWPPPGAATPPSAKPAIEPAGDDDGPAPPQ